MTHLSLFSGVGGIDIAAEAVGFETVAFVEREPFCQQVLAKNFPGVKIHGDITKFDGSEYRGVTLVSGGFPCQPHSVAGKREASGDERDLWGEVVRVLGEAKPRWFLGENVPGLLTSESGAFFGRCLDDLARLGYRVGWGCWGANDVGAVHRRRRVFIVAYAERSGTGLGSFGDCGQERESDHEPERAVVRQANRAACAEGASTSNGEAVTPDTKHDGPSTAALSRSVGESQDEGRLSQPERCFAAYSACKPSDEPTTSELSKRVQRKARGRDGAGVIANACSISEPQSGEATGTERTGRHTRDDVGRSLGRGDWRSWGIPAAVPEPAICGEDDGIPARLVRSRRNASLKALGNAVVPAQVLPILKAIAEWEAQQ